ncbi:PTS glucose transporter subunit IIABC [Mesoplasma seiffertii]|uniref:PTS glucose transporter subunit IIABC n=1 Tax=Mesoplasma seiffertii TaxID=28224 RepID=UPI00047D0FD4|nr:PTS glucose transporter subunit IIABC [Mesoplasma seiffertii]
MKKVIIYAPVDGLLSKIEDLNDGVFSEKMLGDGCAIEPSSNTFYSPVSSGEIIQIFDTKHAYFFKAEYDTTILMHIGLDTVSLEGKPFKVKVSENSKVDLKTAIVEANFEMIDSYKLSKATPIVLDTNLNSNWKFNLLKTGKVKQGEPIGEYYFDTSKDTSENVKLSDEDRINQLINTKDRWQMLAEKIYALVGTNSNYSKVFNCMTRLRFEIKNKDLVDEATIKKIPIVKGVIWAGNQCQIIIGGEVYKVKEAIDKYVENLSSNNVNIQLRKAPVRKRIMVAISSIILPSLPILMAAGLLMGIKSVLVLSGVVIDMGIGAGGEINMNVDTFSVFVNVAAETGLKLLGIFIGYNTMKWLGGSVGMQLLVSLAISGATLGQGILPDLVIFNINGFVIKAGMYTSSIIPHIVSAFLLFYADRWVKTWMPTTVDILFRPLVTFVLVYMSVFFIFGPILFIIEQGIAIVMNSATKIPFGVGVMIFCIAWQPLVLTGMHVPVIMPVAINVAQGIPTTLLVHNVAVFAQLGAVLGVALRTKNLKLRIASIATIPGAIVGVTEPILYGINLPKWKPFLAGLLASGIFGLLSGMLAVESRIPGGLGIFGFTGAMGEPVLDGLIISTNNIFTGTPNSLVLNTVLWFAINLGAIPCGLIISYFMYEERKSEVKQFKNANKILVKAYSVVSKVSRQEALKNLGADIKEINESLNEDHLKKIKAIEDELIKITVEEVKLEKLISKSEAKKAQIIKKLKKLNSEKLNKKQQIADLIETFDLIDSNTKISDLEKTVVLMNERNSQNMLWLEKTQNNILNKVNIKLDEIAKKTQNEEFKNLFSLYWNGIHSLDINYSLTEAKENSFNMKKLRKSGK